MQALEQHRSQQDALHKQLQSQRDRLLASSSGQHLPPQHNSSAGAPTASTAPLPQPVLMQPPAYPDSHMPALPSLPSAILTASGGGHAVQNVAGALPGVLNAPIPAEQPEQPLPWPPPVLPCGSVAQDRLLPHSGVNHSGGQQLPPALPPLLPNFMAEGFGGGGRGGVCQLVNGIGGLGDTGCPRAAGVSSLDTSDVVPQLLQHGSYVHFKEQVRGCWVCALQYLDQDVRQARPSTCCLPTAADTCACPWVLLSRGPSGHRSSHHGWQEHLATSSASTTVAWTPYQTWE